MGLVEFGEVLLQRRLVLLDPAARARVRAQWHEEAQLTAQALAIGFLEERAFTGAELAILRRAIDAGEFGPSSDYALTLIETV